ncbi:co-chaperone YbbN [Rhizocola hellebori]|uniref:Co-chaperone YbbN n=1 Tax=Rhizocola hellebori TaxID=1392758 RepID=A0A8J3Q6A4_9ACTN|nr:tetratricopeptide repeat protein [Rhizocola hellebori]GIH04620.1 co-chaperone YbbN [Rhizocola hellebori]
MSEQRPGQSIFTRGAVDLSALANRPAPDAAGAAEPTQQQQQGPWLDVTEANVQAAVLEQSLKTPVVVAFVVDHPEVNPYFAELAKQNAADGGTWVLARVDLQAQPRLAQMFRVQTVPMVFAIVGGQPVDAQPGILPPSDLRKWLDAVLKAGGMEVETPPDPRLEAADDALIMGDLDEAERAYKKILSDSPRDAAAEAGLAHVVVAKRAKGIDPVAAIAEADAKPDDLQAQLRASDVEFLSGQAEQAYQRLVNLVRRVYGDDREAVRQHLVSLFAIAGPDDPAVAAARRSLASALF